MAQEWNGTRQDWKKNIMEQEWNIYEGRNGNKTKGVKKRTDPRGNTGTVQYRTAPQKKRGGVKARPGQASLRSKYCTKTINMVCMYLKFSRCCAEKRQGESWLSHKHKSNHNIVRRLNAVLTRVLTTSPLITRPTYHNAYSIDVFPNDTWYEHTTV